MNRFSGRILLALPAVCLALLMTTFSAYQSQPASAHTQTPQAACHILVVHLHGTAPATMSCFKKQGSAGQITTNNACPTYGALKIYSDANYEGSIICFLGTGFANMGDYWLAWPFVSWNDQASSFNAGCNRGTLYVNAGINGQPPISGAFEPFGLWAQNNLDGQNLRIPNDSLSSVQITSTGGCY